MSRNGKHFSRSPREKPERWHCTFPGSLEVLRDTDARKHLLQHGEGAVLGGFVWMIPGRSGRKSEGINLHNRIMNDNAIAMGVSFRLSVRDSIDID